MSDHDLAAAYALDALEDGERRAFEQHLRDCARCQAEVVELQEAAAALAVSGGAVAPPPELRERILRDARRGGDVVPLRRRTLPRVASLAAAAAVVVVALGVALAHRDGGGSPADDLRAARAVAATPGARRTAFAKGTLYVTRDGRAALIANLPEPADEKVYEAWVIADGVPRAAGTFQGRAIVLTRAVRGDAVVAVTVEPKGGVDAPTGPTVVRAA
jgi:anti-sigma-K factor RskA